MKKALVILALVTAPAAASAFEWGGHLGFSWTRQDDWLVDVHNQSPFADLDLGLRFRGAIIDPKVAWLRGGANFRLIDRGVNGATVERSNTYTYSLSGALFDNRTSAFTLGARAERVAAKLGGADGQWFGSRTSDSGYASARLAVPDRPDASVGYFWNRATDVITGVPDHTRTLQRLDGAVHQGSPAFNLSAGYTGEWSEGSWLGEQYQANTVRVEGSARLDRATTFTLSDQYFQRTPTAHFDAALASEFNYFQAAILHADAPREDQFGRYVFSHSANAAPAMASTGATQHLGEYWREFRFDDTDFSARATGSVSSSQQSLGGVTTDSSGETLGLLGRWYRQDSGITNDIQVGPSVGLVQGREGGSGSDFGYGANASVTTSRPIGGVAATGRYEASYRNNLVVPGWSITQGIVAGGQGALGSGNLSAQLQLQSSRTWAPLYGAFASRYVYLQSVYTVERTQVRAGLSIGSGIAGSPGNRFVGDGLLLPTPFNSESVFANVQASTATLSGISAMFGLRFGDTNAPGQPALTQWGADGALSYTVGGFRVSLEDRVTTYGYPTGRVTTNVLFFRILREIGESF
jgi:hypothetical protein